MKRLIKDWDIIAGFIVAISLLITSILLFIFTINHFYF